MSGEINCSDYVELIFDNFEYIRNNSGQYGHQYTISYFVLQFIESKMTKDNISLKCCIEFLNKKYLNIQLLSHLKKSKPNITRYIINEGVLANIIDMTLKTASSIEDCSETLFQLSFLFSGYDYNMSIKYFFDGYADSIIRVAYSKDTILDPMLIQTFGKVNKFLPQSERKKYLFEMFSMIEWADIFTNYSGGQIETFEDLADNIIFESNDEIYEFIDLLKQHNYWNEKIGFGILNSLLRHYWDINDVWDIYNNEVHSTFEYNSEISSRKLELSFLISLYIRSENSNALKDTIKKLITNEDYKNIPIKLTYRQKAVFDQLCCKNMSEYNDREDHEKTDKEFNIDDINWESDDMYYWFDLINALIDNKKDINILTNHLKNNYYPNIHGIHYSNWNVLLYAGLEHQKSKQAFYNLLYEESGLCGFYSLIDAYKNKDSICVKLYKRYHQFCKLLTRDSIK